MRISERFELANHSQSNYDFANIRIDWDNELFIDPTRIAAEDGEWFQNCTQIIQDFFNLIFDLYGEGKTEEAKRYFQSSGESNELFLGFTKGFPKGTGNSEKSLADVFNYVHEQGLLEDDIVGRIEDFYVFVPKFGRDLLSDLIASLIKAELIAYTQEQCQYHDIPLTLEVNKKHWNMYKHEWEETKDILPSTKGYPIVFIPKRILVSKYLYSPDKYWSQVVSIWRQQKHREDNSLLHQNRAERSEFASKEEILKFEMNEQGLSDTKQYLVNMTREERGMIVRFRNHINNIQRGTFENTNKMSDEALEDFVLNSYGQVEELQGN